ncbi:MAG: hypothetical protein ACE5HO_06405 [bacterium]
MQSKNHSYSNWLNYDDIVGWDDIHRLDDLLRLNNDYTEYEYIPTEFVKRVLDRELSSNKYIALINKRFGFETEEALCREVTLLDQKIPQRLYYLLWGLKNRDLILVDGLLSTRELNKAIYCLFKTITVLELNLEKMPQKVWFYEQLGLAYFELAGIASHASRGLWLQGKRQSHVSLLRDAIACFQNALKLDASRGQEIDSSHENILKLIDQRFKLQGDRTLLYINPWHLLYISAALRILNDREGAANYLDKARLVINLLSDHQNPNLVNEKKLVQAIYTVLNYKKAFTFDLDQHKLESINQQLQCVSKTLNLRRDKRFCYSPIVVRALTEQYRLQSSWLNNGLLHTDQIEYLNAICSLYTEVPSAQKRDKLIFRFNIPPLNIHGMQNDLRFLPSAVPEKTSSVQLSSKPTTSARRTCSYV